MSVPSWDTEGKIPESFSGNESPVADMVLIEKGIAKIPAALDSAVPWRMYPPAA
jgi:hypothetical protein